MLTLNSENVVSILLTYFQNLLLTLIENTFLLTQDPLSFAIRKKRGGIGNEERDRERDGIIEQS